MNQKLQILKEKHALEEHQMQINEFTEKQKEETLLFVGKLQAVSSIQNALGSQEIRALQLFQQEERYRHLGFDNFVSFLNSDYLKTTKSQYYERVKLLETEGDSKFDLLNEIGVARSTRKLLAAGEYEAITIEGDQIKIGEETADLSNTRFVRSLIEAYAEDCKRLSEENKKQADRLEKGKEDYEKQKQRLIEAENSTPSAENSISNPLSKANALVLGSLSTLADELDNSTIVDAQAYSENSLRLLATQFTRVQEILCRKLGIELADLSMISSDEADRVADLLEDDEF